MAKQKELDLLSAGKTLWNTWRREHAEIQALEPDLHEADLDGAIPGKANFDGANLSSGEIEESGRNEVPR